MPVNLELKIKVKNLKEFKKKLKQIRAEYKGILNQKDIYYKTQAGLLKLRRENKLYQLIKYNRNESGENRWSNFEILKIKGANIEKYFADIFEVETIVEKRRYLYLFRGTRIHLDSVKNLGGFLELETLVNKGESDARKRFDEIINLLSLDKTQEIRTSYRNLMIANDSQ